MKGKTIHTKDVIISIFFVLIVLLGFVFSFYKWIIEKSPIIIRRHDTIQQFENSYNDLFTSSKTTLNLFSLTQRALLKHETRNFEVLRDSTNQLYLGINGWPSDTKTIEKISEQVIELRNATESYGGSFIYYQTPYKNAGMAKDLEYYSNDSTEQSENYLCELLRNQGVMVLDLRDYSDCIDFYKTDHHWSLNAAFSASKHLLELIREKYSYDYNPAITDLSNYEMVNYEDSLLGSLGVKVGPYFVGKDDFIILNPKFDTYLELNHFIDDGTLDFNYTGSFGDALIAKDVLEDNDYYNKYNSLLHGSYVEAVIENHNSGNQNTALIVTHSYGRGLAAYLCLAFKELRYLDPQKGRYNYGLVSYILEHKPNYVFVSYNDLMDL